MVPVRRKNTDMVTRDAENMRLWLVTEGPGEAKSNAKAHWVQITSSQRRGEREENTI